jgi:hypothetical protein
MGRLKAIDIEYMRSIHDLVEIIPVIIQPDLSLRPEIRLEQRLDILNTMETNQINFSCLGYSNYEELNHHQKEPHCPPFMLDWSITKLSFHGLFTLKQVLFQHQYKYLRLKSTEKFIQWRNKKIKKSFNSSSVSSTTTTLLLSSQSTTASSSQEQLKNIKISQYVTKRRHSMERELLIQEKKLQKEFELIQNQNKTELILKELNLLLNQERIVIKQQPQPMTTTTTTTIALSIIIIFLSLFICYQNKNYYYFV